MFHIGHERVRMCSGHGPTRRSFLQAGSAGVMGLSLPSLANPVTGDFSGCRLTRGVAATGHRVPGAGGKPQPR